MKTRTFLDLVAVFKGLGLCLEHTWYSINIYWKELKEGILSISLHALDTRCGPRSQASPI